MTKTLSPADLDSMFGDLERRIKRLEHADGLGRSSTRAGTTRWQDAAGTDQVVVGLLDDASYGVNTVKWVATTSTSGTDMVLSGGLTADHEVIGQAGAGGSGLTLGPSGTRLTQAQVYAQSLTPTSVGANSTSEQTFTVTGLSTADKVFLNGPAPTSGVVPVHARVSAANTLKVVFANVTAGSLTPAAGTYLVLAIRS
jgi:hypothetical protein